MPTAACVRKSGTLFWRTTISIVMFHAASEMFVLDSLSIQSRGPAQIEWDCISRRQLGVKFGQISHGLGRRYHPLAEHARIQLQTIPRETYRGHLFTYTSMFHQHSKSQNELSTLDRNQLRAMYRTNNKLLLSKLRDLLPELQWNNLDTMV